MNYPVTVSLFVLVACGLTPTAGTANREARAAGDAKLSYTRVLKGSVPEYLSVVVNSSGTGTYDGRKLDEPPSPRPLKLSPATTDRLFELAADLNNFKDVSLESRHKVADLGLKTLTYENGGEKNQVRFNYTVRREAQALTDLFEKIASVEEHIKTLEYAIKYDPLGLPRELLQIQIELQEKALVDPELMVPSLRQIASNPRFLHLAQVRAQNILKAVTDSRD